MPLPHSAFSTTLVSEPAMERTSMVDVTGPEANWEHTTTFPATALAVTDLTMSSVSQLACEEIIGSSLVCRIGTRTFLYNNTLHGGWVGDWVGMDALVASSLICEKIGSNASVNTRVASHSARVAMQSSPIPNVLVPRSSCISGARWLVIRKESSSGRHLILEMTECSLIPCLEFTASSVCIGSIANDRVPTTIDCGVYDHPVIQTIAEVMGSNTMPLLWHAGNSLVDLKTTSHVVAILGPCGAGKSKLLRTIQQALHSITTSIGSRVITHGCGLDPDTVSDMVGSRMVMPSDVDHEGNVGISRQAIKTITRGDAAVGTNRSPVTLGSTILYLTNALPSPTRVDAWCRKECVKRFVCLTTCRSPNDPGVIIPPVCEEEEEALLIAAMIYTREAYEHPCGNIESLVATLIMGHYNEFMSHVVNMDQDSEEYDMMLGTRVLTALVRVSGVLMSDMIYCVKTVSPGLPRMPCLQNEFGYGIVGCTIGDMGSRDPTPYEEMTR